MSNAQDPLLVSDGSNPSMQNKHIKKIVVSGVGFFSDAYDLFIINIVLVILARDFSMTSEDKSLVSAAALWGAVMGQLGFGLIADKIGRKKGFIVTLSMVIIGAILSALSFETSSASVFVSLSIFRLFLGIGIGGEYPLSATITAESSHHSNRGRMTALVFSMQGVGSLVASIVGFALLSGLLYTHLPEKDPANVRALNIVWRLALGFGAIPGILSLYFRVTMEETEKFLASQSATKDHSHYTLKDKIVIHLRDTYASIKPHWKSLIGTAGSWFLFDVVFYANGLFSATVLEIFDIGGGVETPDVLLTTAKFNIYLALIALPGYWVGVWLIELPLFGRKNTQIFGLIALTINYIGIGLAFDFLKRHPALFIAFYGLTFFLCNAGPNTTTFVLPSESFPTESRATCHGISAAAGKVGAVVGASMMAPILTSHGVPTVLYICGVVAFLGAVCTYFFIKETRGLSLEEVTNTPSMEAPASPSYSTMANHQVPLENH